MKKGKELATGKEVVMAEYFPPEKLRPAEVGTLIDERADTLDVSATIIDLAVRGFLTIKEEEKSWWQGGTDYLLTKMPKDSSELLNYEKELFDRIFEDKNEVRTSELKEDFYDDLAKVKSQLYKDLVAKKLFPTDPEKVKGLYMLFGFLTTLLSLFVFIFGLIINDILSAIGLAGIVAGFFLILFSRSFSRRTSYGYQIVSLIKQLALHSK